MLRVHGTVSRIRRAELDGPDCDSLTLNIVTCGKSLITQIGWTKDQRKGLSIDRNIKTIIINLSHRGKMTCCIVNSTVRAIEKCLRTQLQEKKDRFNEDNPSFKLKDRSNEFHICYSGGLVLTLILIGDYFTLSQKMEKAIK